MPRSAPRKRKLSLSPVLSPTTSSLNDLAFSPTPSPAESEHSTYDEEDAVRQDSDLETKGVGVLKKTARKAGGKKGSPKKTAKVKVETIRNDTVVPVVEDAKLSEVEEPAKKKRKTAAKKKDAVDWSKVVAGEDWKEGDVDEEGKPIKKPRKKRGPKVKEPIVYDIPDVERLETTYHGRLGYACLNTILRNQKPPVFCARTCRIDTIVNEEKGGRAHLLAIGKQNMIDLKELITWNAAHNIFFMRMSSEMFPFASHIEHQYSLKYAADELKAAGDEANRLGVRLTSHPGQFTQLGSPKPKVVANAKRDLAYHCEMMERMGLGKDSVMIIHGGGTYGDKTAALNRFRTEYITLPSNIRDRLVLENDEICYNVDDLLPLCEELNIPLVLDYHHDWIYPSSQTPKELMPRILKTWERKGIKCKQHQSEPRRGAETIMEKRAHADRCQRLPEGLPDDMDLMIEAKDKEQAVFHLFRIYDLHPVLHDDLRPPALEETKQTAGRKGNKRASAAKKKAAEEAAEEETRLAEEGKGEESGDEGLSEEDELDG